MGTMPLSFWHFTWRPEIAINTEDTLQSAINSISCTARLTDCTTRLRSFTPPLSMPLDEWLPTPTMLIELSANNSPTTALTLLVPMSKPTISFLSVPLDILSNFDTHHTHHTHVNLISSYPVVMLILFMLLYPRFSSLRLNLCHSASQHNLFVCLAAK